MHKIYIPPHTVFQQSLFWKYCMRGYFMDGGNMKYVKYYLAAGLIFTAVLGTLSHFFYGWSGQNPLIALFSPVSESTWEHMKLVFFPLLFWSLFAPSKVTDALPALRSALLAGGLAGTWSIPVLFYTYSGILGRNIAFIDIAIFYIAVLISFGLARKLCTSARMEDAGSVIGILTIIMVLAFFLFTFSAPRGGLFAVPG